MSDLPALARRIITLIDLTALGQDCDIATVDRLCARARQFRTAAVCVWPEFVVQADAALAGAGVGIATVVNFPTGVERVANVVVITEQALTDGATEIDLVLPYRALLAGDLARVEEMVHTVRRVTAQAGAVLKVIIESGELDHEATVTATRLVIAAGADFVKTSTGMSAVGATPEAVTTILTEISQAGATTGLKVSGGVATAAQAAQYLAIADEIMGPEWVTPTHLRIGASRLVDALVGEAE